MYRTIKFADWYNAFSKDIDELVDDILNFFDTITYDHIQTDPDIRDNLLQYLYENSHNAMARTAHLYSSS